MLAKDPAKRPQSPEAVAEKLADHTKGSDIQQLAMRAAAIVPAAAVKPRDTPAPIQTGPRPQPMLRRRIPVAMAIAAGLLGALVGFAMGILITITTPDGSNLTLTVPDGSDIGIQDTVSASQQTSSITKPSSNISPIAFAVLVGPDVYHLDSAAQLLKQSDGKRPVTTEIGTWYPVAPGIEVPRSSCMPTRQKPTSEIPTTKRDGTPTAKVWNRC